MPREVCRTAPLLLALGALAGCSSGDRYAVMSTLFDGVPPPGGAPKAEQKISSQYVNPRDAARGPSVIKGYFHKPYVQERCGGCHPKRSPVIPEGRKQKLCFTCHEHEAFKEELESYKYAHGPVITLGCLLCHEPHESDYPGLLVEPDPNICLGCHEKAQDPSVRGHENFTETECLPCHDPHGGEIRYFLRGEARG